MKSQCSVCVIIPIYQCNLDEDEIKSLHRSCEVFATRQIIVICPNSISESVQKLLSNMNRLVKIECFADGFFKSTRSYNHLLLSRDFYFRFSAYEWMLICQLDVYVLRDGLNAWMRLNFHNVGAPIFEDFGAERSMSIKKVGGNGGFCLRNVQMCIKVIESLGWRWGSLHAIASVESRFMKKVVRIIKNGFIYNYHFDLFTNIMNEDLFWSIVVPYDYKWFRVPDSSLCARFAFDANPAIVYKFSGNKIPLALHAWCKYDKVFCEELIAKTIA